MFKPFYIHINQGTGRIPKGQARGATIFVSPSKDDGRSCIVQASICSRLDAFCKKTGRRVAGEDIPTPVPTRKLHLLIADVEAEVTGKKVEHSKYEYIYRFMV
jgi:hypothetical protein